jgi:hypothetical protein
MERLYCFLATMPRDNLHRHPHDSGIDPKVARARVGRPGHGIARQAGGIMAHQRAAIGVIWTIMEQVSVLHCPFRL